MSFLDLVAALSWYHAYLMMGVVASLYLVLVDQPSTSSPVAFASSSVDLTDEVSTAAAVFADGQHAGSDSQEKLQVFFSDRPRDCLPPPAEPQHRLLSAQSLSSSFLSTRRRRGSPRRVRFLSVLETVS